MLSVCKLAVFGNVKWVHEFQRPFATADARRYFCLYLELNQATKTYRVYRQILPGQHPNRP